MLNIIVAPYDVCDKGESYTKKIVSYLKSEKVEFSVYFSKTLDDVVTSVQEVLALGETEFVVVGNDIVLNKFLNAVKDVSKIKLGIVPTSRHDDFSEFLGISSNPIQAIKDILTKHIENIDYLILNDQIVLNNILVGASAEIFEVYNQYKMKNAFTQKLATMQYGDKFEGISLNLDYKSSKAKNENIFELSIANGGISRKNHINPLANVKDGLFNLNYATVLQKNERKKYLNLFKSGKQIYDNKTKQFWLNQIKITNEENHIKAIVDGTLQNLEELNVRVVEGGLKLYKKENWVLKIN